MVKYILILSGQYFQSKKFGIIFWCKIGFWRIHSDLLNALLFHLDSTEKQTPLNILMQVFLPLI